VFTRTMASQVKTQTDGIAKQIDNDVEIWVTDHRNAPVLRSLGDGIGDRSAGSAQDHDFARLFVHHVEKGFHTDRSVAL